MKSSHIASQRGAAKSLLDEVIKGASCLAAPVAFCAIAVMSLAFGGCSSTRARGLEETHLSEHSAALLKTETALLSRGSLSERAAIKRFSEFFASLTEERAKDLTRKVYAPDAYFNDTLKTLHGAAAIEEYFVRTARNVESMKVDIQDVAHSGADYYFRWTMDVRFRKLKPGQTVRTIGITQIRFDNQGRVTMHQDYWDSAAGLWDHVPVIGGFLRSVKEGL